MNIYVGNIPYEVTEDELRGWFQDFGEVANVSIMRDKTTGYSRGFGFVEMPSSSDAQQAIEGLNGRELKGRQLVVNEARPRSENSAPRQPGNRGGGGRHGGGGGRHGGGGGGGFNRDRRGGGGGGRRE